ncbi:MAG TPA: DUF1592 domain-containing protein [Polyangia bacterium]|nr:DUF1592 domain-containing protein [Polyangia bacterium]
MLPIQIAAFVLQQQVQSGASLSVNLWEVCLQTHRKSLALAVFLAAGCGPGVIGSPGSDKGAGAPGGGSTPGPSGAAPAGATAGPTDIRRLSRQELSNTVQDLFPALPAGFTDHLDIPDDNAVALAFAQPGTVSDLEVKRFMDLSEAIIGALGGKLPAGMINCAAGSDDMTCARTFITGFGKRAYRRPLDAAEVGDLLALYTKLRGDSELAYGRDDALTFVVEAMLQSPGFLYRWERGLAAPQVDGHLIKFDDYEMASRLSYLLWKSMPDDTLMAAADAHHLASPDEVAAQAQRLLADPRADQALADFVIQWLELGPLSTSLKDTSAYPTFKPELFDSMRAETVALSRDVLRGGTPTLANLLTARYTFVDQPLAAYYGVTTDGAGRADLAATGRVGLLTQGSVMAVKGNSYRTSPVRRGKFVLNRLLCTSVPPPPPFAVPELPAPDPTKTVRQQMAEHRANPACAGCHGVMDPIGYGFEHFDGAGKFRQTDNNLPIDSSGTIGLDGATVAFKDATELATALASSANVRDCFATQWLRYALGRFEQDADAASVQQLLTFYEQAGANTRDLIIEITRTLPFSHRAIAQGEVTTP